MNSQHKHFRLKFFSVKITLSFFFFLIFQFKANENIQGTNTSLHGTWAHYIRIHPVGYSGTSPCLRIALYGCDSGNYLLHVKVASIAPIFKSKSGGLFMCAYSCMCFCSKLTPTRETLMFKSWLTLISKFEDNQSFWNIKIFRKNELLPSEPVNKCILKCWLLSNSGLVLPMDNKSLKPLIERRIYLLQLSLLHLCSTE